MPPFRGVAGDEVHAVDPFQRLAGLGGAQPHAVADRQPVGDRASSVCASPAPSRAGLRRRPAGNHGEEIPRPGAPDAIQPPPWAVTTPGPGRRTTGTATNSAGTGEKAR